MLVRTQHIPKPRIISDIYKYMEALSKIEPGSTVKVVIVRNSQEMILDVKF